MNGISRNNFQASCFCASAQQFAPHFVTQRPQGIEPLVVELRPAAHAGLLDLAQPLRARLNLEAVLIQLEKKRGARQPHKRLL
jgi:hypothetical protein